MVIGLCAVLLLLCVAATPPLFLAATPAMAKGIEPATANTADTRVQAAIDRIQADDSYQLDFPQPQPIAQPPDWLRAFFEWLSHGGKWIVYTLVGLLIGAALLYILYLTVPSVRDAIDRVRSRFRRQRAAAPDEEMWAPDHGAARNLLGEADMLASEGRYGEAVHLLMGRSVEDITRRRPGVLKPALTARSIATLDDLPAQARVAFGRIAEAVERSLWARQPIAADEWSTARAAYEDFAFGAHWRGHAMAVAA
ncbi:MAG: DUF4129 domain-containing protein [Sphingopyxis sp.]